MLNTADMVADHSSGVMLSTFMGYMALYIFVMISYIATLRYMATKPAASLLALRQLGGHHANQQTQEA